MPKEEPRATSRVKLEQPDDPVVGEDVLSKWEADLDVKDEDQGEDQDFDEDPYEEEEE